MELWEYGMVGIFWDFLLEDIHVRLSVWVM
jgi:hypothetical protein